MPTSHPPSPGAPRRAFSRPSFSVRRNLQHPPLGKRAVLAARGRAGEKGYASGCDSPAALPDDRFDKPAYDGERVDSTRASASYKSGCRNR